MKDAPEGYEGGGSDQRRSETELPTSQMRLRQALHTLRGVQQRCKLEQAGRPDWYSLSVNVALGRADMFWISAAIDAVERAIATDATEAGRSELAPPCNVSARGKSVA